MPMSTQSTPLAHLAHLAIEAASAPAVKATATGATVTSVGDWLSSGPGLATALGLLLTLLSLAVQMWFGARRDQREQREHDARMHIGK